MNVFYAVLLVEILNVYASQRLIESQAEEGKWYQGDLDLPGDISDRNAVLYNWQRWPHGVVYYRLDDAYSDNSISTIRQAFKEFHTKTCIMFLPVDRKRVSFVDIRDEMGCSSHVGFDGKVHITRLHSPGCVQHAGTIMHELMHTLGFHHEHARADRDKYVHVNWTNIIPGHERNFDKLPRDLSNLIQLGLPYDYESVMHYAPYAFAADQVWPTIIPIKGNPLMGQRVRLSPIDVARVNRMYDCKSYNLGDQFDGSVPYRRVKRKIAGMKRTLL